VELAADKGWIGGALRTLPDWMRREADRVAEQNAEYQQEHQDPDRLPLPNPWPFFLSSPVVPQQIKKVCQAAESQLVALRHLGHMRMGIATLNTDWHGEAAKAKAAGDKGRYDHAVAKLASTLPLYAPVQE